MTDFNIEDYIAAYPDFPIEGILFRDISPLLASHDAMSKAMDQFYDQLAPFKPEGFAGIESRGFLFSTLMADSFWMWVIHVAEARQIARGFGAGILCAGIW